MKPRTLLIGALLLAVLAAAAFFLIPTPAPEQPQQPDIADTVVPTPPADDPPAQASGPADTTHDLGGEKPNWDVWGGDPGTMESDPIYSEGVGDLDQTGLIIH